MSDGFPNPFTYEKALNFIKNISANPCNHYFAITINDEAVGGIRITSYNVCYSKLLRFLQFRVERKYSVHAVCAGR